MSVKGARPWQERRLLSIVALGICLLAWNCLDGGEDSLAPNREHRGSKPATQPNPTSNSSEAIAVAAEASAPKTVNARSSERPGPGWIEGLASADPYAVATRLRDAKQPGSFAAAMTIIAACRTAWAGANAQKILGPTHDPLGGNAPNEPNYAKRLQARDLINTRCEAFTQHQELGQPLADDMHGQRLMRELTKKAALPDLAAQRELAAELAAQGHLHLYLGALSHWNGRSYLEQGNQTYGNAYQLAKLLATAPQAGAAQDLRVLAGCVRFGHCANDYGEYWFSGMTISPAERQRIEAMAKEMATAMRAGDYSKFLPQ